MQSPAKVALVTGGARRVGRAIVERLSAAGFEVAFTYCHSRKEAEELVRSLAAVGRRAQAFHADFSDAEGTIPALAAAFREQFQRLDVLVNNAAAFEPSSLHDATPLQVRRLWSVHVQAPLLLCRQFYESLRDAGGHVINMLDLLSERPVPEYLVYCATKAALANLTLGLARELAPRVTVNGIAPGVVHWADTIAPENREHYLRKVPLGRAGSPEDVANLVHFLCTEGTYITGQIIRLDGGRSIT